MLKTSVNIQTEIGVRLARARLSRNVTQSMLAKEAGISTRTLRRLENGESSTFDTFLRVALALDLDEAVLSAIPTGLIRPIERVSKIGSERKRARPKPKRDTSKTWTWGDNTDE